MTKKNLMPAIVLSAICIAAALLLSVINIFTGPRIADNKEKKANEKLVMVYPGGSDFKKLDLASYEGLPASITAAYSEGSGGFVIQSTVTGWKPGLVIMCGIDANGKIVGADYIASNETLGAENGLGGRFVGKDKDTVTPDLVAGPTAKMTTGAYYNAIKDALLAYNLLKGGKTLEQSLNAALGIEGVEFDKWLVTADIEGIDAVYTAKNNSGRVYVIGESFIGIKADGTVMPTEASADEQAKATAAETVISSITFTEITEIPEGVNDQNTKVTKISVANNGTYVFEISAKGYSSLFEYSVERVPMIIKLAISADGKIMDVITVSHNESSGYGDECATEEYYEQYKGKGDADIKESVVTPDYMKDQISEDSTDIGAISSATYTTVGYQRAVKAAFAAFNALTKGGND